MTRDEKLSDRRQRLRSELRNARRKAGLTQRQVANAMDWSASKMLRIETGEVGITPIDLRALLACYDVRDERRTEELVNLVRGTG